jgi:hypothetical protein
LFELSYLVDFLGSIRKISSYLSVILSIRSLELGGFMRLFVSAVLATAVLASSALAGETANTLAPGKPAGVKTAQLADNTVVIGLGLGLVAAGIAVAASSGNSHNITTVSTSTSTSP